MDALKWAGIIGAAALAVGAGVCAYVKGKPIPAKYVDFLQDGSVVLNKTGQDELGKITKFIKGIKDSKIISGKVLEEQNDIKTLCKIADGKISEAVSNYNKDGVNFFFKNDCVTGVLTEGLEWNGQKYQARTVLTEVGASADYTYNGITIKQIIDISNPEAPISKYLDGDVILDECLVDGENQGIIASKCAEYLQIPEEFVEKINFMKQKIVKLV